MKKIAISISLMLMLGAGAMAQSSDKPDAGPSDRLGKRQVVRTYEKFPDSSGDDQEFTATTYESKPGDKVYDEDTYVRYEVKNKANNGVGFYPTIRVVKEGGSK